MTYLNNKKTNKTNKIDIYETTAKDILTKEVSDLLSDHGAAIIYNENPNRIELKLAIQALLKIVHLGEGMKVLNKIRKFEEEIDALYGKSIEDRQDLCFDYSAELAGVLVQYYIA